MYFALFNQNLIKSLNYYRCIYRFKRPSCSEIFRPEIHVWWS